ncbi:MAG: SOS response-associated peptidase family protein [Desulfobulbaceae bacterium]
MVSRLPNRMPVILEPEDIRLWLDLGEAAPEKLLPLLHPPEEDVEMNSVSTFVNKPQNEGKQCIEPASKELRRD